MGYFYYYEMCLKMKVTSEYSCVKKRKKPLFNGNESIIKKGIG